MQFFSVRVSICLYAFYPFHISCSRQNDISIDRQIKTTCMSPLPTYRYSNERNLQDFILSFHPLFMWKSYSHGTVCNNCYISLPFAERYVTILLQSASRIVMLCNKKNLCYIASPFAVRYVTICYIPSRCYIPCLISPLLLKL
jgi:hypothetical protein